MATDREWSSAFHRTSSGRRGQNRNTAKAEDPGPEAVGRPQHTSRHGDSAVKVIGRRLAAYARSCGYEGQCYAADTTLEAAHPCVRKYRQLLGPHPGAATSSKTFAYELS
jgi:hypothetical protein